jgi:sterol desaturase/sphingolipid hydroxylase (fatty acid hydroxylase superfamily)
MGGRLETFLGKAFFDFIFSPAVFFKLFFLGRLIVFTTLEFLRPARALSYLQVIWQDLLAYVIFRCGILPICIYLNNIVPGYHPAPAFLANLPLPVRVVLYFILADFGHYWMHRLTHTRYFWRVHKWHHSPTYMYWLGGVRTTIPDFFLVNIPYVLAYSVLYISPWWMAYAMAVSSIIQNDWMHTNFTWRSKWMEWIFVTPRYHHIHHSDNPQHYGRNLGSLLTVWDRIFGTYLDPEKVDTKLSFGIGEKESPVRMALGV